MYFYINPDLANQVAELFYRILNSVTEKSLQKIKLPFDDL